MLVHNFDAIQTVTVNFQSFLCLLANFLKYRYFKGRVVSYWIYNGYSAALAPSWAPLGDRTEVPIAGTPPVAGF